MPSVAGSFDVKHFYGKNTTPYNIIVTHKGGRENLIHSPHSIVLVTHLVG